ncbi:hypothetical protein MKW92_031082 [Papaver armeniacum]|nr:hypothetical protein MKW92_031082 [Papaver armeniacum]
MADKPVENQSAMNCTLFQPLFVDSTNNAQLRHVNSGKFIRFYHGSGDYYGLLSLMSGSDKDVFTFIDWESVVMLPDLIRIKGDNTNHLRAYADGFMDFNHKADNSSIFDYEVSPSRDGGIRLQSTQFRTYWTDMDANSWVLLKQASPTVHDTNTIFLPTILGGNRIVMRCLKNGLFCKRLSTDDKNNCLATINKYPDEYSTMEIEEPVISRKINNVRYRLIDARRYDEKTVALVTDDSSNRTRHPLTSELNLRTTVSNTTNWSNSVGLTVGVEMTFTVGLPVIEETEFKISTEVTGSWDWGESHTTSQEVGSVKTIVVPPMTRLKGSLMATRLSYDIPFSYTQRDVLKNGRTKVSEKNDGIFTAHNGYGYQYEVVELPLQ